MRKIDINIHNHQLPFNKCQLITNKDISETANTL